MTASRPTATAPAGYDTALPTAAFVVHPLVSAADQKACVALQREIWGATFDPVPATILQVADHIGGVALGAFDVAGQLAGFVFGLTGIDEAGNVIHWSHMLAVRTDLQDAGLGRRLKECQRQELCRRGIARMYWTYDPLVAKNAHLNLNVLGASVVQYVPDMYGQTGSPLHHGLATDRLIVLCDNTRTPEPVSAMLAPADTVLPVLTAQPRPGDPLASHDQRPQRLRLEIPPEFSRLLAERPDDARAWHTATREHFQWALGNGYSVIGLRRDAAAGRSFYLLQQVV